MLRSEVGMGQEPYQFKCMKMLSVSTKTNLLAPEDMSFSCKGHGCRQCLHLYSLAGAGAYSGDELWGTQ